LSASDIVRRRATLVHRAHANVGGGYETDLLAQAPLRWMMKKAESHGLSFRSEVDLDGGTVTAPITDSYKSFGFGLYAKVFPPLYRTISREPDIQEDGSHCGREDGVVGSVAAWGVAENDWASV